MAKYNRSEIMKNAWRTYKYVGKKQGKTFAEVLSSTWRIAKVHASMEEAAAKRAAERAATRAMHEASLATPSVSGDYKGYISHEALYGRSFASGNYVGD